MFEDSIRLETIPHRHSDRRTDGQTYRNPMSVSRVQSLCW